MAENGVIPYMERLLPYGETGRQAEVRITKAGFRMAWQQRWREIQKASKQNGKMMSIHDAAAQAFLDFPPDKVMALESKPITTDEAFVEACREGFAMKLPKRVGIERELDWVSANLHQSRPDLMDCPSVAAINFLIDSRLDAKVRATFWATFWSKRLSPGDKKAKRSGLKEDVESESESDGAVHDEELMKRMFGGGE